MTLFLITGASAHAATFSYADVVLDFYDSGVGPMAGPYGGTHPGGPGYPIPVSLDVVLGDDPGPTGYYDFLSLPTGSYVTVGFTDESIIDGPGDDLFITEVANNGETASVFVSHNGVTFSFLGVATGGLTSSFDLNSIGFSMPVMAVKIQGLDTLGGSPGFDVVNVRVLNSGPPVPEPTTALLLSLGLGALGMHQRGNSRSSSRA